MTVANQMEAAHQYAQLWAALMPDFELPATDQFTLWAGQYPDEIVSRGINRAAGKRRKLRDTRPMTLIEAVRYASSVMRNEALGVRKF